MSYSVSIIIPVYKNTELFLKNLEHNKKYFTNAEIIISNDYPPDNLSEQVKKILPDAITLNNSVNLGFGENVNRAIKAAQGNLILLLNSDVKLLDNSYAKTFKLFDKDAQLFAVSFAQKEKNGHVVGGNTGAFIKGLIQHQSRTITQISPNFWAEGGSMIFKKDIFKKLHGFDSLYTPFYWEDIDLSYRARKSGYHIVYDPSVLVEHQHESTISTYFSKKYTLEIAYRNQFIFHWKNITDGELLISHLLHLPLILFRAIKDRNSPLITGFFKALVLIPAIVKSRAIAVQLFITTDRKILQQFT